MLVMPNLSLMPLLLESKLLAKGTPTELLAVLGCLLDMQQHLICLLNNMQELVAFSFLGLYHYAFWTQQAVLSGKHAASQVAAMFWDHFG